MSLIKCPECGREVSTAAQSCPGCGYPISLDVAREELQEKPLNDDFSGEDQHPAVETGNRSELPQPPSKHNNGWIGIVAIIAVLVALAAFIIAKVSCGNSADVPAPENTPEAAPDETDEGRHWLSSELGWGVYYFDNESKATIRVNQTSEGRAKITIDLSFDGSWPLREYAYIYAASLLRKYAVPEVDFFICIGEKSDGTEISIISTRYNGSMADPLFPSPEEDYYKAQTAYLSGGEFSTRVEKYVDGMIGCMEWKDLPYLRKG